MRAKEKNILVEMLAICGFDVEQGDLPLEKRHFVSYGCKNQIMVNDDWDGAVEYEEARQRMKVEVEESLVDLVMNQDASFFVFSNDLNMLAAVKKSMVAEISFQFGGQDEEASISARRGIHAEAGDYVARMQEKGRYEERSF